MRLNSLLNVFVLLICKSLTFSGDLETILGSGKLEAGLFTDYLTDSNLRDFVVEACSPVWDRNYLLTNSFQTGTLINIPEHTWEENYSTKFYMYGWTHCESLGAINSLIWDTLGYGLYKITCTCVYDDTLGSIKTSCFYLDWRDDRYHSGFQYVGYYPKKDFAIIFDENLNDNRFSYRMYEVNNLTRINDNSIVGVWEILQANPPIPRRVKFQPTTPTNLNYENTNGHPRLIWNLSEPQEAATYEVWRKSA